MGHEGMLTSLTKRVRSCFLTSIRRSCAENISDSPTVTCGLWMSFCSTYLQPNLTHRSMPLGCKQ